MFDQKKKSTGLIQRRPSALASKRESVEDTSLISVIMKNALLGAIISAISAVIMISIFCVAIIGAEDPNIFLQPLAWVALLVSMFIGGLFTAKRVKDLPLICGLVCGAIITLFSTAVSLVFHTLPSSSPSFLQAIIIHSLAISFSIIGAFAGNVKKKARSHLKRYR